MRKVITLLVLAIPASASAATFDFTTLGANNTLLANTVVVGGVTARGFQSNLNPAARYVLFTHPAGAGDNNDYLVWRGALGDGRFLVPEPGTLALLGAAAGLAALRRRTRR